MLGLALSFVVVAADVADVRWEAPLACPSADAFRDMVGAYLGRPLDEAGSTVVAEVRILEAHGGAWRMQVALHVDGVEVGRHELESPDCDVLAREAAALIATSIDPFGLEAVAPASPPEVVVQVPTASQAPPRTVVAPATDDEVVFPELQLGRDERIVCPRPVTRVFVGASGGASLNLFASLSPGVHAQVGAERGPWRVGLHGGAELGRFRSASDPSVGGDMIAWDLGVRACWVPRLGRLSLRGCAAVGAGSVQANGVGLRDNRTAAEPWVWAAPELGLGIQLGRVAALTLDLGAGFSLRRPSFRTIAPDSLFVVPVVAGRAQLGVELRFPKLDSTRSRNWR